MSDLKPLVIETTSRTFQEDAIERSRDVPVVVDFWARWCGPCRLLGPLLEKLAHEYDGKFVLVKADTEEVPDIAAGFGVRSIPAVFGLRGGRVVDSFVGALPEAALRAWIDGLLPSPAERLLAEAQALEATDAPAAEAKYRAALALAPDDPQVKTALARFLLARDRIDEARELIHSLEARGFLEPEAEKLRAELDLRAHAREAGGVARARAEAAAHPGDPQRALGLAQALAAAGQFPEALDLCLDLVERDRKGVGDAARQTMLSIFHLLTADSELATEYRRKLAALLY